MNLLVILFIQYDEFTTYLQNLNIYFSRGIARGGSHALQLALQSGIPYPYPIILILMVDAESHASVFPQFADFTVHRVHAEYGCCAVHGKPRDDDARAK